jgi:ribosomal protein L11 methyltransferase
MAAQRTASPQTFVKAEFHVPAALADEAAGILTALGALGCAAQWPHRARRSPTAPVTLQAFFKRLSNTQFKAHRAALDAAGMLDRSDPAPAPVALIDPGWAAMWKTRFKPLEIGRRLIIVPPWQPGTQTERIPIIIDPGQGFGTGHHATTRCTLIAVETECGRRAFDRALDVGTGSGILALAMARLGIKRIVALDHDPVALDNARHNAELNGLAGAIRFSQAPSRLERRRFPLITANILASTLIAMAPELKRLLGPGGRLILSGILKREARDVMAHYGPPIRRLWSRTERGWTTLVLALPEKNEFNTAPLRNQQRQRSRK